MSVVPQREPMRRSVVGILERQLDLVLDVTTRALSRARRSACATRPGPGRPSAEERCEEVGERVGIAEEFFHLLGRHGAEAAAAGATDIPAACEWIRPALRTSVFVHPPVGAELVVLLARLRIAQH